MRPLATVVLCTYNRATLLRRVLDQLSDQQSSSELRWNAVIVDNNSNDETASVAREFTDRMPERFTYRFIERQGKAWALNQVLRTLPSDIFAFTDDDVDLDRHWLEELTRPLLSGQYMGSAGRIIPVFSEGQPSWLRGELLRELRGPLVAFDLGDHEQPLTLAPYGANMAFRREMFDKYGGFRTDLGPIGRSLRKSEDIDFGSRVIAGGEPLLYAPKAVVHHPVERIRLRRRYYLNWWFNHGVETAISEPPDPKMITYLGVPRYILKAVPAHGTQAVLARASKVKLSHWCRAMEMCGRGYGAWLLHRKTRDDRQQRRRTSV